MKILKVLEKDDGKLDIKKR